MSPQAIRANLAAGARRARTTARNLDAIRRVLWGCGAIEARTGGPDPTPAAREAYRARMSTHPRTA